MRILVAPDKFKGSLGAEESGRRIAAGLRAVLPQAEIEIVAVADGGEGTAEILRRAGEGEWVQCATHDALGRDLHARYTWLPGMRCAVLETSAAAGLAQLAPNERNPLQASTWGVGEMLRDAARRGAREIILGLGGSATNDAGVGMARALGFRFLDVGGEEITGVGDLQNLSRIERPNEFVLPPVIGAADVSNPLLGPRGASRVFGPQKGATPAQIEITERALARLAEVVANDLETVPGAGAAGGLGFGLLAFCAGKLRRGFVLVAEAVGLHAQIARADFVITGEGKLDRQTLDGKAPAGVARIARALGKPVFAIVGECTNDSEVVALFDGIVTLDNGPDFNETGNLLESRARVVAKWLRA